MAIYPLIACIYIQRVSSLQCWALFGVGYTMVKIAQSCPTLCDPVDYTVRGILQARILEWVAFSFPRWSSQPRDRIQVSRMAGGFFTSWATRVDKVSSLMEFEQVEEYVMRERFRSSLALQWLGLPCFHFRGHSLITGWGTKVLHALKSCGGEGGEERFRKTVSKSEMMKLWMAKARVSQSMVLGWCFWRGDLGLRSEWPCKMGVLEHSTERNCECWVSEWCGVCHIQGTAGSGRSERRKREGQGL